MRETGCVVDSKVLGQSEQQCAHASMRIEVFRGTRAKKTVTRLEKATRSAMMSSGGRQVDAMQMREQDEYANAVV